MVGRSRGRVAGATVGLVAAFLILGGPDVQAQSTNEELASRVKALEEQIRLLRSELEALKAGGAAPAAPSLQALPPPVPTTGPAAVPQVVPQPGAPGLVPGPLPVYGGATALAKIFNPDISVIGNFLGAAGRNAVEGRPALGMHETEVALQAIVDPFARADFFLTFSPEGVGLEEGYITFTALPAGLVARAGKFRAAFGKVNLLHNDGLPWTDRPLVTERLGAGEEGINDAGLSVSRIFAGPRNLVLEGTAQVFRGEVAELFQSARKSDIAVVGHLRGYKDISESSNLDLGFSYARGHNELGSAFLTELYGVDATFRWKPLRRAIYHSFLARSELVWSRREERGGILGAFGFYTAADYRLSRRWTVGGRYDWSERMRQPGLNDSGFSALLTYWPSEFSQIRGQYRFARYAERRDANELRFQFLFNLGVHGAHPF